MTSLTPKSSLRFDPWIAIILVCFIVLAWASWGKLIDLTGDTGNEVEIAARLAVGQVPYRDVETYYTPLAYYVNALTLWLFGFRLEVFYAVGLVLALIITLQVYHLAKLLTNAPWATLCTVYVLVYCAFSPWGLPGGAFTLTVPYSYGAVYATLLCLLGFIAVDRYGQTAQVRWLVGAAIACGFAGLAKQEYGIASLGGVLVGVNLCSPKNLRSHIGRSLIVILVASSCVVLSLAWLTQQVSWQQLQMSLLPVAKFKILVDSGLFNFSPTTTLTIWRETIKTFAATTLVVLAAMVAAGRLSSIESLASNQRVKVFINLVGSIVFASVGLLLLRINISQNPFKLATVASLAVWILVVAVRFFLKPKWIPDYRWVRILVKVVLSLTFTIIVWYLLRHLTCCSNVVFRPLDHMAWLPPLLVGWFALKWRQLIQHRHAPLLWTLLVFSVLLTSRFWFYIHYYKIYGVTAILLFFTLLYRIAQQMDLPVGRLILVCLFISSSTNLVELGQPRYAVRSTYGTVYTLDANLALAFNQIVDTITASKAKSVSVIPVGSLINFLTATHSPNEKTIFSPGVLPTPKAEREFLARVQKHPPDLVVYVDYPFSFLKKGYQTYAEYNPRVDYWIRHQHHLVYSSPALSATNRKWTIRIYAPNK